MTDKLIFREAKPKDAADIVSVVQNGFSSEILNLLIYGCHGIILYLSEMISIQHYGGDKHYTVMDSPVGVQGFVEFRIRPNILHLDYIGIAPSFRNKRFANKLLREGIIQSGCTSGELTLDVFENNSIALSWYEYLGFRRISSSIWIELSIPNDDARFIYVEDYAQAQASQREYGFSHFIIRIGEKEFEIGRLGSNWYRIREGALLEIPGVNNILRSLDPHRRILLIQNDDVLSIYSGEKILAKTIRMNIGIHELMSRLNV